MKNVKKIVYLSFKSKFEEIGGFQEKWLFNIQNIKSLKNSKNNDENAQMFFELKHPYCFFYS